MSFISSIISALISFKKNVGNKKDRMKKTIRNAILGFLIPALLMVAILFGAIYSVTGAVSELFSSVMSMFKTSDETKVDWAGMSEEQIAKLIDETGASLEPKKVAKYIKIQQESVPSSWTGTKKIYEYDGDTKTKEENKKVTVDVSSISKKYITHWEFLAAVDLASFNADSLDNTTVIDEANLITPKFTWYDDCYKTTTTSWYDWDEVYETDSSTGKTKKLKTTYKDAKEQKKVEKEPLAIPKVVETMFGDYHYKVNRNVLIEDSGYTAPFEVSYDVETRKELDYITDDLSKPIYKDDLSKPIYKEVEQPANQSPFTDYNVRFTSCNKKGIIESSSFKNIRKEPNDKAKVIGKLYKSNVFYIIGKSEKWFKIKSSDGTIGYMKKTEIKEGEDVLIKYKQLVGYEQSLEGYKEKKVYKTITTTTKHMSKCRREVKSDKAIEPNLDFDPTDFLQYMNKVDLQSDDLELVNECLKSLPKGSAYTDMIQRIIDGGYTLDSGSSSPSGGSSSGNAGSMAGVLPLYIQWDTRWGSYPYAGNTIAKAGCCPTSMAMVVTGLMANISDFDTNNDGVADPKEMAIWATNKNLYVNGQGSLTSQVEEVCKTAGLNCYPTLDFNEVITALKAGKVVVDNVSPSKEIGSGYHFLVLTGVDSEGKIEMNDPNSIENSNKGWEHDIIKKVSMRYWIIDNPNLSTQQLFIMRVREGAMQGMKDFGVSAAMTIAQGIVESGSGTSDLALQANNLFGIMAYSNWTGKTVTMYGRSWRAYNNWSESVYDHSRFFVENSRYSAIFSTKDWREQVKIVGNAGYCEPDESGHQNYINAITNTIIDLKLYLYDEMVLNGSV